jgi:hypothetical protein
MELGDRLRDGEAESRSPAGARLVSAIEALENPAALFLRHTWPLVADEILSTPPSTASAAAAAAARRNLIVSC